MSFANGKGVEDFLIRCREQGLRITPQSIAIVRELSSTKEHPAAETLYERIRKAMPTISLDTVYRTLALLESRQMVWTVATVGGRARYDATTVPHYHFICRSCRSVTDIISKTDFRTPKEAQKLGNIDSVNVQLHGMCNCCRQTTGENRRRHGKSRTDQ